MSILCEKGGFLSKRPKKRPGRGGGGGWGLKRKVLRRVLCVCMRGGGGEELGCLPVWLVINF